MALTRYVASTLSIGACNVGDEELVQGRAVGGKARAAALSPERRSEIASLAARARHTKPLRKASHAGMLEIADLKIACYVLEDGTRVLSQRGLNEAFGIVHGGGDARQIGGQRMPRFIRLRALESFIPNEITAGLIDPIEFAPPHGGRSVLGLPAILLPDVCNVWLKAREERALTERHLATAQKAEILTRALAHVGIIALVDEATGYQDERTKTALRDIFNAFLRRELAAWVQRFPEEIFRLRGWNWRGMKVNRPQVVAYYTVDLVYSRLLPHIMEELESRMPRTETGRRKGKLHQLFSDDVGHPALAQHLYAVITLMRVSDDWETFMRMLDKAHPRKTDKWLKELLQASEAAPPIAANDSSEPLPPFEQLQLALPASSLRP
jgi:P63C domain-containing protein